MRQGISIFESEPMLSSEELVDKAYEGLVSIMDIFKMSKTKKGEGIELNAVGCSNKIMTPFYALVGGVYVPAVHRCYWGGRFDVGVDMLPDTACVCEGAKREEELFRCIVLERVKRVPRLVLLNNKDVFAIYRVVTVVLVNGERLPFFHGSYFSIDSEGYTHPAIDRRKLRYGYGMWGLAWDKHHGATFGPAALSLEADRKYLWNVEVAEDFGSVVPAKMHLGVDADMIKSLAYARETPLTASGRRSPILHWVKAHRKRIKRGIDFDVRKHLRGTECFDMGGFTFKITNPTKPQKKPTSTQEARA